MVSNQGSILLTLDKERKSLSVQARWIILITTGVLFILGIWRMVNGRMGYISFWLVLWLPLYVFLILALEAHSAGYIRSDSEGMSGKIGIFNNFDYTWQNMHTIKYESPFPDISLNDSHTIKIPLSFATYDVRKN